ncbi:META domain-containing protein [Belliella kenyensis]|uniref:META domain-containing protein n=1 Tax=Belliella kenyensis TaxID=1472724 RepID=A0ABV8EIG5_9BACT|nr:META domain-containing protein [Belliella kenyensis]MCH7401271.1 META domain-containing protein [Belliella kenyensis]MDN3602716.1 META domain-containing protein [Belliella kenyensis]
MKKLANALFLLVFLSFSSCSSINNFNPLSLLTGNNWVLSSILGGGLDASKFTSGIPFLNFMDGGKLAGFAGCNNFNGNFQLDGTSLSLDPGAMTKKACQGGGEDQFLSLLNQAKNVKVAKNKLTLLDGAKELMSFVPQQ